MAAGDTGSPGIGIGIMHGNLPLAEVGGAALDQVRLVATMHAVTNPRS